MANDLKQIVSVKIKVSAKIAGQISSEDLVLDPCTNEDIVRFYPPRSTSES